VAREPDLDCPIARSLSVFGERWTLLILREALLGATLFSEFSANLGIATDVLSQRLRTLVEAGVMQRVAYQEPGQRARDAYELTEGGRAAGLILGSLGQWAEKYLPRNAASTTTVTSTENGQKIHVAFVDESGREVPRGSIRLVRANRPQ
jgi:DNA-binding HxlR family transcriptional regulator